jgi:hypothetical protein
MLLPDPIKILDLNDFLPPHGEDRIEIFTDGGALSLDIFYEMESRVEKLRIRFPHASYFCKTPFPGLGYGFPSNEKDQASESAQKDLSLLDSLVEYRKSKMVEMIHDFTAKSYGHSGYRPDYRHYRLFLHSVGIAIQVISEPCEISNQGLID